MSITAVLLTLWIATQLPDFQGQHSNDKQSLGQTARIPGVRPILFVTLTFVLAHNILYTYIVPLLQPAGLEHRVDAVLFLFGCVSLIGIWFVGAFVDRWLWQLAVASCLTFLLASAVMGIWPTERTGVYASVGLWGLAFGGAATIFQTAMARTAKADGCGTIIAGYCLEHRHSRRRTSGRWNSQPSWRGGLCPCYPCTPVSMPRRDRGLPQRLQIVTLQAAHRLVTRPEIFDQTTKVKRRGFSAARCVNCPEDRHGWQDWRQSGCRSFRKHRPHVPTSQ